MQPSITLPNTTYAVTNAGVISVGCQDVYNDKLGSFYATAALIATPTNPGTYVPQLLSFLMKRGFGSNRTTISDMYLGLWADDGATNFYPGNAVSAP